jgi:hypothetical protein
VPQGRSAIRPAELHDAVQFNEAGFGGAIAAVAVIASLILFDAARELVLGNPRPGRESGRRAAATGSEKEPTQLDEFATASALPSIVSKAIFWASKTSPRTNSPFGMKHQRMMQRPD